MRKNVKKPLKIPVGRELDARGYRLGLVISPSTLTNEKSPHVKSRCANFMCTSFPVNSAVETRLRCCKYTVPIQLKLTLSRVELETIENAGFMSECCLGFRYSTSLLAISANRLARRPLAKTTDGRREAAPRCFVDEGGVLLSDLR